MTEQELQTIFESEFSWENWRKVMDFVFPEFDFSAQKIEIDQFTKAAESRIEGFYQHASACLLYTSPSPRDQRGSRMPSSA